MKPIIKVLSSAVRLMEGALIRLTVPLQLKRMAAALGMRGWRWMRSKSGA